MFFHSSFTSEYDTSSTVTNTLVDNKENFNFITTTRERVKIFEAMGKTVENAFLRTDALPALTVPSFEKTGGNLPRSAAVVCGLGCSSVSIILSPEQRKTISNNYLVFTHTHTRARSRASCNRLPLSFNSTVFFVDFFSASANVLDSQTYPFCFLL